MPIRPFLNGEQFDQETMRILGVAFAQVCVALRIGDCDDDVRQAIANKIIELAKTGDSNPDLLCERANVVDCLAFQVKTPRAATGGAKRREGTGSDFWLVLL
jgi:hypothetical protein